MQSSVAKAAHNNTTNKSPLYMIKILKQPSMFVQTLIQKYLIVSQLIFLFYQEHCFNNTIVYVGDIRALDYSFMFNNNVV